MPVIRRVSGPPNVERFRHLVEELSGEIASPKEIGQPVVEEETFPRTGLKGLTVIWDKWSPLRDEDRTGVILEAYGRAVGEAEKDKVAFAVGLTMSEAADTGKLPYSIEPWVRESDGISLDRIREVVLGLGGTLIEHDFPLPQLRFATREAAEEGRKKLLERLPGSEQIWLISQDGPRPE